jgi:hypothetical protein
MTQRTTFVLMAVLLGLVILGRTELGIAGSGIRIGQATPFATLAPEVKFPEASPPTRLVGFMSLRLRLLPT